MASIRDIKGRIKSIKSTQQITKAMKLVSSVKLQKERDRFEKNKFYVDKMKHMIASIAENSQNLNSIYLNESTHVKKIGYIVITSDRGLCGGYNQNVLKEVMKVRNQNIDETYFALGRKGKAFFQRNNMQISESHSGISEQPAYEDARRIGEHIITKYADGEFDEVKLIYTVFHSMMSQEVVTFDLLPVNVDNFEKTEQKYKQELNFEPSDDVVLDYLIPKYMNSVLYGAMIEASVCEEAARMTSMDNATKNAGDIIDDLTLIFNRARQAAITKEITEIVSGANALA
ncbi:MAG: ATP synthase F1 subunit gamma [Clostridiales bacterium GWE2_32_10]|nr:MAG: ATP synthase F1 subunit gamma [Clostridiales bacterium GWE2_32_10]HBY19519.1 ATP synthase F1 subunit gamma [Clostridiales bacterium]